MEHLREEFSDLGFDLLGLGNLIYFSKEPEVPVYCPGGHGGKCDGGCTNGCFQCSPGKKNG